MASIKLKGDTSGELTIQAPSVAGTNTLNLPASSGTLATTAQASIGMKNRIINGNMTIDQRNAGASVTVTTGGYVTLDRWVAGSGVVSKYNIGQNAGAVTPPIGFINYLGCTSLSAYTVGASEVFNIQQRVEGFNLADLGWGTANAKTVTLSFQVYSSLTGTFGGSLRNSALNRSYPFSYSIPVANTWTQISITIAGDTSGTWLTTNGIGMFLVFSLGTGSTLSGTAGAWAAANYASATGATSVVGTSGATWYITGVQLEVGTEATPFEHRPYDMELQRCQRYYQKTFNIETAPAAATGQIGSINVTCGAGTGAAQGYMGQWNFPVVMRTTPTVTTYNTNTAASSAWYDSGGGSVAAAATGTGSRSTSIYNTGTPVSPRNAVIHATAEAEL